MYKDEVYQTKMLTEKPRKMSLEQPEEKTKSKPPVQPADNHPWREPKQKRPRLYYDESDRELLEALFNSSRA